MKNINTLNIRFTSDEADNNTIWAAGTIWHNLSTKELAERLDVDFDCAKCIKSYLIDEPAIAEGVNVEFWFD
jgi:hypothetical protein